MKEKILKLLKSDNEEDYTLGYELLMHQCKTERVCNDLLHESGSHITLHHFGGDRERYYYKGAIVHPDWENSKYIKNT